MVRFLMKLLATALSFVYVLPMINGIEFHGTFVHALILAAIFSLMLWGVELLAMGLAAVWTITTFGVALLFLIPLWIVGFWILPAIALKMVADTMPQYLTIYGFWPAVWGGLVILVIGMITGGLTTARRTVRNEVPA